MYGATLRRIRLSKGRTLDDVATAANITAAQLSRLELGTRNLDLDDWIKILRVLGEKPGDWLENSGSVTPELRPVIETFAPLPEIERGRLLAMVRASIEYAEEHARLLSLPQQQDPRLKSVTPYTDASGSERSDGEAQVGALVGAGSTRKSAHVQPDATARPAKVGAHPSKGRPRR